MSGPGRTWHFQVPAGEGPAGVSGLWLLARVTITYVQPGQLKNSYMHPWRICWRSELDFYCSTAVCTLENPVCLYGRNYYIERW